MDEINYEELTIKASSEAQNLVIQATIGCSNNGCTFYGAYLFKKFRVMFCFPFNLYFFYFIIS